MLLALRNLRRAEAVVAEGKQSRQAKTVAIIEPQASRFSDSVSGDETECEVFKTL